MLMKILMEEAENCIALWKAIRDIRGMCVFVALTIARQPLAFSQSFFFFSLESFNKIQAIHQ